jgi:hypothetical protein
MMDPARARLPDATLDALEVLRSTHAWDLVLSLDRAEGRYRHAIAIDIGPCFDSGGSLRVVVAVESAFEGLAPERVLSPVFQEYGPGDGHGPWLLVGQARRHHFSAAIERAYGADRTGGWFFDIADRFPGGRPVLSVTYRVELPPALLVEASESRAVWRPETIGGGELILEAAGPAGQPSSRIVVAEAGRCASLVQILAPMPDGATARCRYRWLWRRGAGSPGDDWT